MTKQSIFVEYILLQKKSSSFAGAHWQINTTILQNQPGENVKLNKFEFGTQGLYQIFNMETLTLCLT